MFRPIKVKSLKSIVDVKPSSLKYNTIYFHHQIQSIIIIFLLSFVKVKINDSVFIRFTPFGPIIICLLISVLLKKTKNHFYKHVFNENFKTVINNYDFIFILKQ